MKKKYLMTFLLATAFIAAWSVSPPTAEAQSYYGDCGDGVIEVNPYAGAEFAGTGTDQISLVPTDTAPFGRPENYFFYRQDPNNPYTYNANAPWSRQAGEMCDGLDSTILCWGAYSGAKENQCTLVESWPEGSEQNCYWNGKKKKKRTGSERCGKGVGNGIIQPANGFDEECDDGNITPGDGCSPLGKYELGEAHVEGVCGNGVVEDKEKCDDFNNRNGDGCNSNCQPEDTHKKNENGKETSSCTTETCGNGRIDYALGEQCDDGGKNGTAGSECTDNCILKSSPRFEKENEYLAWWPVRGDEKIDMFDPDQVASEKNKPRPLSKDIPNIHVVNRGQKIIIERQEAHQYSGVFLSGQKIEDLTGTDTYKDHKIHFNMVVSMTHNPVGITRWDDDAFGLVFGIKKENQDAYVVEGKEYKYLMLSWRSLPFAGWQQAWAYPGCIVSAGTINASAGAGNGESSLHGPAGLRLYQVSGAPSYTQLWTMNEKCTTKYDGTPWDTKGSIKEIRTDSTEGWTSTGTFPWTAGANAWNKVINPFLPLNTFYALDFGIGQDGKNQRLQIDAEFSKDELKVWVNRQPAIHVTREKLEKADPDIKWPTEGELGFYIMGMDNLTIDTSGTYSNIRAGFNPDDITKDEGTTPKSSSCSHFCGNGIVEGDEKCDDGNTVDYDGCSNDCKKSTATGPGGACETMGAGTPDEETLCYGGTIDQPDGTVGTPTPVISGEYSGATDNIIVEVKNDAGQVVCEGSVRDDSVVKEHGKWKLETCELPNGEYTATASFVPTQTTNGTTFPTKNVEKTFTVDVTKPTVHVDKPLSAPAISPLKSGDLPVSGTSSNATEIKVKVCTRAVPLDCEEGTIPSADGTWSGFVGVPDPCKNANSTCTATFTPVKSDGTEGVRVERDIKVVDEYSLPQPTIDSPPGSTDVIPNADGTVTVQGKIEKAQLNSARQFKAACSTEDGKFDAEKCKDVRVKIKGMCPLQGTDSEVVYAKLNPDWTFEADVPLPDNKCQENAREENNGKVTAAIVNTSTGNFSNDTGSTFTIKGERKPIISFTCPTPTNPEQKCKLPDAGEGKDGKGLVVNGQTNIHSPRTVVVKAYKKTNPDAPCKMADLAEDTPDVVVPVKTTNNGKWAADLQGLRDGSYCIVADLKSTDDKTIATTLTTAKDFKNKKSPDDVTINGAEPYFTAIGPDKNASDETKRAAGTTVAQDISDAIKNAGVTERPRVPVTIAVDPNQSEGVTGGDLCDIWVKDNPAWSGTGRFTLVDGKLVCTADVPVYNDGESLAGKTLVGVARQPDKNNVSKETNPTLTIPGATITDNGDGTATITLDPGYPAKDGNKVTFTGKNGKPLLNDSTNQPITCILKEGEPKGTLTCKSDVPLTKDNAKIVVGADVGSAPVPARGVINGNDDGSDKPDDGTHTVGPGPVTGKVTYNNDGTATVTDIEGAKPNGTITVTPTYKDKDGNVVTGTGEPCTVQRVGGLLECQTENLGVPPGATPTKVVAKTKDGQVVGTWFPKKDKDAAPDKNQITAKYNDGGSNTVTVTIPRTDGTPSAKLKPGETVKVSIVGNPKGEEVGDKFFNCKLEDAGAYFTCTSNGPFVDKDGNQYKEIKVEVVTEGPKKPQIDIGTAYLFGDSNSTDNATGFVAGGCSTTDSPASGLVALLLAALGFFVVRRRKE